MSDDTATETAGITQQSVFQRELGPDFDRLDPVYRRRVSMSSTSGFAQLCSGVMTEIRRSPLAGLGAAVLGPTRRLGFPPAGTDVPFELANYAYQDSFGRETLSWSRRFHSRHGDGVRIDRFNDVMIYSPDRGCIVNYLGSHSDIAADIHCRVTDDLTGMRLSGGRQRLYQGPLAVPIPSRLGATATVVEAWDAAEQRFTVDVDISSPIGSLFGYRGWFTVEEILYQDGEIPDGIRPAVEREPD